LCSAKVLGQEDLKIANLILQGVKKAFFHHFKCYNLAIYVINFFEKNSIAYFNNPKEDPTIESNFFFNLNYFMQFVQEVAVSECSFQNHNRFQGILGINDCLRNIKKFNKHDSKLVDLVWLNAKNTHFFTSNIEILHSTRPKLLRIFHTIF
jgi:hypothetical protein